MPVVSDEFMAQFERFAETVRREAARRGDASFVRRTPGVCGGRACVRDTRVPIWVVVQMVRLGRAEVDLLTDLPTLVEADLDAVWSYYRTHPTEIELDIAENNDESA